MNHLIISTLIIATTFFTTVIQANSELMFNPLQPNGIHKAGNAYQRFDTALNWLNAQAACTNLDAHLATITSQNENAWIQRNLLINDNWPWIGGSDEALEGTWSWITDETWDFTQWGTNEPNGVNNENHLMIFPAGTWNDSIGSLPSEYICEWENNANAVEIYFNDFSYSAGIEWSDATVTTINGESFLAPSAYGLGNETQTLMLTNLPAHDSVTIIFDLYIIRSWDGNGEYPGSGPDNWQLTFDGNNLLFTNFANFTIDNTQAYPHQLPPYGEGGAFAPRTAALTTGHLGLGSDNFGDTTYQLAFTFEHTDPALTLVFDGKPNQEPADEGWGLDNVWIGVADTNQIFYPITVTKTGTGSGTVTSTPAGINCGNACSANFADGSNVTLTATAANNAKFIGWSGACVGTNTTCSLTVNAAKTVSAMFNKNYFIVTPATTTGCIVTPNTAQNVTSGSTTDFTVTPMEDYTRDNMVDGTCPMGSWNGNVWTTGGITTNCTVNFHCSAIDPTSWLYPINPLILANKPFTLEIQVDTNSATVGAHDFKVSFNKTSMVVDTAYQDFTGQCQQGVCPGTGALLSTTIVTDNNNGTVRLIGFDATGTGPSNDLQIAIIHFIARTFTGSFPVGLITTSLTTPLGDSIGLAAKGTTINISPGLCGNSDGNGVVNIIDALAIVRYLVGLPPPPTIGINLADVDRNGVVSIVDAMKIARYSVGLVVVEACNIGSPLPLPVQ